MDPDYELLEARVRALEYIVSELLTERDERLRKEQEHQEAVEKIAHHLVLGKAFGSVRV